MWLYEGNLKVMPPPKLLGGGKWKRGIAKKAVLD